ncbi:hypothetical protein [Streptomyces sp. NPDC048057]|uniref:hypothetical protein n=1 Tax=Streptomyces sp. NPDC048057 TaxID=3155628 RepID=UPI0033E2BF62
MIALIRTRTLNTLRECLAEAETEAEAARAEAELCLEQSGNMLDVASRAEEEAEELRAALDQAMVDVAHLEGEMEALRAQSVLDTEDRQALRTLLRIVRKQSARADLVYVLFRSGELHSVHATQDAAQIAAEAEGARRDGWTTSTAPCAAPVVASEIPWNIRPVHLGGTR